MRGIYDLEHPNFKVTSAAKIKPRYSGSKNAVKHFNYSRKTELFVVAKFVTVKKRAAKCSVGFPAPTFAALGS